MKIHIRLLICSSNKKWIKLTLIKSNNIIPTKKQAQKTPLQVGPQLVGLHASTISWEKVLPLMLATNDIKLHA
jgi:hypothetical protein